MIPGINFSNYQRIASMNSSLNNLITQASIAKSDLLSPSNLFSGFSGIGSRIDIFA